MLKKFRDTFNLEIFENEKLKINYKYGIIKEGDSEIYESISGIQSDFLERTVRDTLILLADKDSKNKVGEMNFNSKNSDEIRLLSFEKPMLAPVLTERMTAQFSEFPHDSGDKVFIIASHIGINGQEKEYVFIYSKANVDILKSRRVQVFTDSPIELALDNTLIISPSLLMSIHDVSSNILLIKNVTKAEVHHNLAEFFEFKAREILSETVRNASILKLNKSKVNTILKNGKYFKLDYINDHMEMLQSTLNHMDLSILELDDGVMTEPSIVFENATQLNSYIDLMSQYITRHILQQPEEALVSRNV